MLGAASAALGVPLTPASFAGGLSALANHFSTVEGAVEDLFFEAIRSSANVIAINLQSVELIPMRSHDNAAAFQQTEFAAWTESSTQVYVDIQRLIAITIALAQSRTPKHILADCLAISVFVLRHESHHVEQFIGNNNARPADFATMISFEEQAYGKDVTWLNSVRVKKFMLENVGTEQAVIDDLIRIAERQRDTFKTLKGNTSLTTDGLRRDAMKKEKDLPEQVRGKTFYDVPDLYLLPRRP